MPRYKLPSIAEQGGLEVYLSKNGVDYELFMLLRGLSGQTKTSIAKGLSDKAGRKIWPDTVEHWLEVADQEEQAGDQA